MSHGRRGGRGATGGIYRHCVLDLLSSFLPPDWKPTAGMRGHWCAWSLTLVAILMHLSPLPSSAQRFAQARRLVVVAGPRLSLCGRSFQGFFKALMLRGDALIKALTRCLQQRLLAMPAEFLLIAGWNVFGVDGSYFDAPRTTSNRRLLALGGTRGANPTHPQLAMTALYHLASGVLWSWRIGPVRQPERTQFRKQIKGLPRGC